jgi:hypothetical protein
MDTYVSSLQQSVTKYEVFAWRNLSILEQFNFEERKTTDKMEKQLKRSLISSFSNMFANTADANFQESCGRQ